MYIEANAAKRGKRTVLINTDQIVSIERHVSFLDIDYSVTMTNGKTYEVEDDVAKRHLESVIAPAVYPQPYDDHPPVNFHLKDE